MSSDIKHRTIRTWRAPAIVALATIMVAATVDPDANWARVRTLPQQERQRLMDNLKKFDLLYSAEQQKSLRDLDRRLNELDPAQQAQYLAALRRYRNWLNQLPELKQSEIRDKPLDERMAAIKKLVADHPVARASTARFLQLVDVGDFSPFELAAIYQVWRGLKPAERQTIEKMNPAGRRAALFKKGEDQNIIASNKLGGYDEDKWGKELETWLEHNRPALLKAVDQEGRRAEILRRQAINHHFLEEKHRIKSVASDHLAEFLNTFPPWLRSSFDHYAPDEARRRLTVVYRLVFPPGSEINGSPARAKSQGAIPKAAPPRPATSPAGKTPVVPGNNVF